MSLLTDGYALFQASEGDHNDGAQACEAILHTPAGALHGSTLAQRGHAEMDALFQYAQSIHWDPGTFRANRDSLFIECLAKPCCVYCSAVLGNLGIRPRGETRKTRKYMGISFALHHDLRRFISQVLNVRLERVEMELQRQN